MPRRKQKPQPTWISAKEAAKILSDRFGDGRVVNDRYIRREAARGKIETMFINSTQSLYSKEDVEAFTPSEHAGRSKKTA